MHKIFFILIPVFILFGINPCLAQKTIQKEFSTEGIKTLIIRDDAIFKLNIESSQTNSIKVIAHSYGENSENVVIEEKLRDKALYISTGFSPYFEKINDKLAANKVMSIEMEITLPKQMSVQIESKIASVTASGNYKNVDIGLGEGSCTLKNFSGNAMLLTKHGNITVFAQDRVKGTAFSRRGKVENKLPKQGKYAIKAESINGSIFLFQTE
jgi:hypothetical protein